MILVFVSMYFGVDAFLVSISDINAWGPKMGNYYSKMSLDTVQEILFKQRKDCAVALNAKKPSKFLETPLRADDKCPFQFFHCLIGEIMMFI